MLQLTHLALRDYKDDVMMCTRAMHSGMSAALRLCAVRAKMMKEATECCVVNAGTWRGRRCVLIYHTFRGTQAACATVSRQTCITGHLRHPNLVPFVSHSILRLIASPDTAAGTSAALSAHGSEHSPSGSAEEAYRLHIVQVPHSSMRQFCAKRCICVPQAECDSSIQITAACRGWADCLMAFCKGMLTLPCLPCCPCLPVHFTDKSFTVTHFMGIQEHVTGVTLQAALAALQHKQHKQPQLHEQLPGAPLPFLAELCGVLHQAASALQALHNAGVPHGDLSCETVLLQACVYCVALLCKGTCAARFCLHCCRLRQARCHVATRTAFAPVLLCQPERPTLCSCVR